VVGQPVTNAEFVRCEYG